MTNILLILCVFSSVFFLLTQFFIHYYSFGDDNVRYNKPYNLYNTIKNFQSISSRLNLDVALVDVNLLRRFWENELSHRISGTHDHETCKVFCNSSTAVFMTKGTNLRLSATAIQKEFLSENFDVDIIQGYDVREESLEQRYGKDELIYHIFLRKLRTIIHIVVFYPRLNHEWNHKCFFNSNHHIFSFNSSSIFCSRENIFKPFEVLSVVIDGILLKVPSNVNEFIKQTTHSAFLSCNYNQARKFYSIYGIDRSDQSEEFRAKAKHILTTVVDVLSELNIPFWLSSGTCLGWYRQCGIIPHSKDVDIGIWIKDYKGELISTFVSKGFALKHLFGKIEDSFELSFQISDLKLDIFFFYEEGSHMWNGGTQAKTGKKFKYIFDKFDICWTIFFDLLVRIPCDTETYIQANYGSNWNVLMKTWDWKASPPNVRENGEWQEFERKRVIQMF